MGKRSPRLQQLSEHQWQLELELDNAAIEAAVTQRLSELRPRAEAPGFRRGKAPMPVLQRVFGAKLRLEQWRRAAQKEVRHELAERGLMPVMAPRLEPLADHCGVLALFELFPALPSLELDALTLRRPALVLEEADIDYMLEKLNEPGAGEARRAELRQAMEVEAPEAIFEEVVREVESALLAAVPALSLPVSLLEAQIEALRAPAAKNDPAKLESQARRLLGAALLLTQVARQEEIRIDPAELWQETERLAAKAHVPAEELDHIWGDGARIQEIEEQLLRHKVVEAVLAKARLIDVPTSFAELARRRRARRDEI